MRRTVVTPEAGARTVYRLPAFARPPRGTALAALLLCVAFFLSALVGLALHFPASLVYFVWPPSVIVFVSLLLALHRSWWVLFLALFPVHMLVEWRTVAAPLGSLVLFYVVVWIQALVGALCVERLARRPFQLIDLRSLIALLLGGAGAAALAEAVILATILVLTSPGADFGLSFIQTLFADALTMIVLAPALLTGCAFAHRTWLASGGLRSKDEWVITAKNTVSRGLRSLAGGRLLEASLLAFGLLAVGLVAFGGYVKLPSTLPALLYAILPLLLWTAVRFGLGGTSLALSGLTLLSIVYAIHGRGPFTALSTTQNLLSLQLFFIAIAVPLLVLAVIMQERRQAQEELEQSEERYRAVVGNFPNGAVLLFDAELRHLFADGQGVRKDSNFAHAVVGNTVWEAFPAALAAHLAPRYQATLAGISTLFDVVANDRTYNVQTLPIYHTQGTAGMVVMQDITEQRRAEALAELDRAKTVFFSNVSHELRTPLTLLLSPAADALADREELLPPRQRERLELIYHGGLRLYKLVNTLLDFSRIEAGRIQASYEPIDLAALTAELASTFRSAIERVGLRLVVDCPPLTTLPQPAYVDREMWEKIVLNLLSNALKFTFAGAITVSLRSAGEQGSHVELEVRDTGTGIPTAELPHLFERFHRVQGARARTQEGTGIGLALVWELARLHGGTVRVSSRMGVGSSFIVVIPTGCAHLPAERVRDAQSNRSSLTVPWIDLSLPPAMGATPFVEEALRWLPDVPDAMGSEAGMATSLENMPGNRIEAPAERAPEVPLQRGGDADVAGRTDTTWPRTSAPQPRVLVADDNADMRAYLVHLLGEHWAVEAVANGAAALASAQARPPNLVLADVMMPGLDGFALLRALRADPSTCAIPVLLLSARAGVEATVEGLDAGADDYLVKPFTARELLARVRTHIELARVRGEAAAHAAQLGAIFEAQADGVAVFDTRGYFVRANRALSQLVGVEAESEYARRPFADRALQAVLYDEQGERIPAEQYPHWRVLRGEMLAGASAVDAVLRTVDGREIWVSITGAPVRGPDGQITGAVLVARDVTSRRQLEQHAREQASELEAIFDAMADGVAVYQQYGRLVRAN